MNLPPFLLTFWAGIRAGDFATLMILLGILAGVLVLVTVVVNVRAERRNRSMPPPDWGSKSSRYRQH